LGAGLARLRRAVWRLVLWALGLIFMGTLLALGLVLGVCLYLWAKLRGRPLAPGGMRWARAGRGMPGWATPQGRAQRDRSDVVDIEAREVPRAPHRLDQPGAAHPD
jgi:hypothetical protein